jgi:hypothetical protein
MRPAESVTYITPAVVVSSTSGTPRPDTSSRIWISKGLSVARRSATRKIADMEQPYPFLLERAFSTGSLFSGSCTALPDSADL